MAEAVFREMVKGVPDLKDIRIGSAGVSAANGQPASTHAQKAVRELGLDLGHHRSQPLTRELVAQATHLFALTRAHRDSIAMLFPEAASKTRLLCEFTPKFRSNPDVPDPIGMGLDAYLHCRDTLRQALPGVLEFLQKNMTSPNATPRSSQRPLRVALGADHGGAELKQSVHSYLSSKGIAVSDFGAHSPQESVDYPDYARAVSEEVASGQADFGILVCRSGIGMSIAANRNPQIRASLVDNPDDAKTTRQHNNANVLCLAANHVEPSAAPNRAKSAALTGALCRIISPTKQPVITP